MFQSVGLVVFGLCVALGVGVPVLVNEFSLESIFGRNVFTLFFGVATILLGLVMIANGLTGILRRRQKGRFR